MTHRDIIFVHLIKKLRKSITEHFSGTENMITSGRNALPVDARVKGVGPARRPIGHRRAQQVVRGGLLNPAKKFTFVWASN
jgi:hypothetical protein